MTFTPTPQSVEPWGTRIAPAPVPHELAWLALIPTTAPALTADERTRIEWIRRGAVDARTAARCDQLLAT